MKACKRLLLLCLVSSLFLTGCGEESGFSVGKKVGEDNQQQSTMGDDLKHETTTDNNSNSGATGGKNDNNNDDVKIKEDETGTNGQSEGQEDVVPTVDLGNQITTFTFTFVKSDEECYANVSYEDDPFDKKYDFAYYTVNDTRLDKSEYRYKEIVDNTLTYKIYLGSNESGTYVIKFFNSEGKQYGRVNVSIKFKSPVTGTPYISIAFNLVQIRAVSLVFSVQNVFKKIGDFFSNLFNQDRISL